MQSQISPPPTTATTTDSDREVFFADPCSMCGTKKRRLCPLHQTFDPRKKLFTEPSANINSVTEPPKYPDSVVTMPPEKKTQRASSVGHLTTIVEESSRDTEDGDWSSETDESQNTTSPSPVAQKHRHRSHSPVSASKPPRAPKRHESGTNNNNPRSSSPVRSPDSDQTRSGGRSSVDKESWNAVNQCLAMFTKLMSSGVLNNLQERPPQEIIQQKKGFMELIDSENILKGERGVYKGSCQCSCGKKYQMILSILPE